MHGLVSKIQSRSNCVVSKLRSAKRAFFKNLCKTNCDTKKFWSTLRSLKPKSSDCPSALSYGSTTAITKQSKADILNQFFTSSFNPSVVQHSYGPSPTPGPLPDHLEIIPGKVATLLKKIKPHSASGPHSISAWMLRFLPMLPHLPLPLSSPSPSGMAHYPKIGNLAMLFLSPRGPTRLKFNSTDQSPCCPSSARLWSVMFSPFHWSTLTPCVACQTVNLASDLVAAHLLPA